MEREGKRRRKKDKKGGKERRGKGGSQWVDGVRGREKRRERRGEGER